MVAAIALLCLIWGTTWAAIQIGLRGVPPFTGVALRFALSGFVLLALALARGVPLGRLRLERRLWLTNGLLTFTISYGIVYWSEQWVPSGLAAVLFAVYPLVVAILAHFFLPGESLGRRELGGIAIGFLGVGVIFSEDLSRLGGPEVVLGAIVLLLSPLASAAGSVAVKRWGAGVHPFSISAVPMLVAAVLLGLVAATLEREATVTWDRSAVLALLYLALVGSALTFTVYFWLLARLPVKRLALIAYVIPLVAVGVGLLRGERLTWRVIAGALSVVAGVALAVHPGPARRVVAGE